MKKNLQKQRVEIKNMMQRNTKLPPDWERKTAVILGILILISGIYQTFFGETEVGLITLLCFIAITIPGFYTKNAIKKFPIEIEIILLLMILFQFVLGEARDFYTDVPYYDKIVHYMIPMFLGVIGFLIFYTLHITGKLKTSITIMMYIVILITIGLGAAWEVIEYSSDVILYPRIEDWHHFQGNDQQSPLDDTMTDLIDDTLGAIFGAFLSLWILGKDFSKNSRRQALLDEIGSMILRKPEQPDKTKIV